MNDDRLNADQVDAAVREIRAVWKYQPMSKQEERHWRIVFRGHAPAFIRAALDELTLKGRSTRPDPGDFSGLCWKKARAQAEPESTVTPAMEIEDDDLLSGEEISERVAAMRARLAGAK